MRRRIAPRRLPSWLAFAALAPFAAAQETQSAPPDDLKTLQKKMEELEQKHDEEMQELRDQIDELSSKQPAAPSSTMFQSLNAFNPQLTVFANFLGRLDSRSVFNDAGEPVDDRFWLREAELDFRAAIDPWADGVLIATYDADSPGNYDATIEEGYLTLKKLPLLDEAPLGIKFQIGRFRPAYGRINKIHDHDLPWLDRPPSVAEYFGSEGFVEDGIAAEGFIPTPGENNTLSATVEVMNGGDVPVGADNSANDPAYLQHVSWFCDLAPGHDIELGESTWFGRYDSSGDLRSQVLGVDATYHWKPYAAGEWRSFLLGGEAFVVSVEQTGLTNSRPVGAYAWTQYQLDQNLYVGARYDWHEALLDESVETRQIAAFVTYYTTEFLRFRVGYEHTSSDDPVLDDVDSALFEINIVFGSHPTEPYWVNK